MKAVTKSELIEALATNQPHLSHRDVEYSVNALLDNMGKALVAGRRVEIRGFGSISLRFRDSRAARNPKTGDTVLVPHKYVPHFKPGRPLRDLINHSLQKTLLQTSIPVFDSARKLQYTSNAPDE
jgi:integration host factor subunit beta